MDNIPSSPSGKMSPGHTVRQWERILGPCLKPTQAAKFQCLLMGSGQTPEWYRTDAPASLGGSWIPSISDAPNQGEGCSLWRIIEPNAPRKSFLTPFLCTKYLAMAKKAGCRFPEPVEAVLRKQGGIMPGGGRLPR